MVHNPLAPSSTSSSSPSCSGMQHRDAILSPTLPATPDVDVGASCPKAAVPRGHAPAPPIQDPSLLDHSLPQPFPLPSPPHHDIPTPLDEGRPDLSLSFAGAILPSTDASLPAPPIVKTAHSLRLPSFDLLGIAAPHPDRIPSTSSPSFFSLGAGPLSKPEDPLHVLSPPLARVHQLDSACEPFAANPELAKAKVERIIPVVTPPTEPGSFNWGSLVNVQPGGLGSPPSSDPGLSPNLATTAGACPTGPPASSAIVVPAAAPTAVEVSDALGMAAWVQVVKDTLTSESRCQSPGLVKILSHALPCPSAKGHLFGQLIADIHDRTTTHTSWINVFHAVPGRFTLLDLPKSPPSTPGPAVGGDEYFTSKVFDSAVAIPDYQLDSKLLPPSPRPVVPPGSVDISIVERYIPPTNTNEYAEMFLMKGRSLLHDRLAELSSDSGLLLFIYPTRTGARTFMQDYLGPILDPLLRSITVVHDLSSDLGKSLGQMSSVAYLDEYERLKSQLEQFCNGLSESSSRDQKPSYQIIHASKEEVWLDRSTWAGDWWVKQEKTRIRETVNHYFRQSKKLPESEMTGSHLIQEVLDGVMHRKHEGTGSVLRGIEVGVFIVKKTV